MASLVSVINYELIQYDLLAWCLWHQLNQLNTKFLKICDIDDNQDGKFGICDPL